MQKLLACESLLVPTDYSVPMGCLDVMGYLGAKLLYANKWWMRTTIGSEQTYGYDAGGCQVGWEQFITCGLLHAYLTYEDSRLNLIFGNDFILFYFLAFIR